METGELTSFTLEEMAFYEIRTTYNRDADCPKFKEFLKQILTPEDVLTLQEWSGYILLPDYREHKILWCHGAGRNGKGAWARTIEGIIGKENCSEVPLNQFDGYHRFAMERLYGKLFNQCSEPIIGSKNSQKVLQTSLLKAATGQDTIEAEIKGKQKTIKFRNVAKITVIANRFPKVEDNTTAFRERRLFVTFPNEFIGADKINDIEKAWLDDPTERSGILNWMLDGLHRLLEHGHFTEGKTQQETEVLFQRASDTIGAFLTEMAIFDRNLVTTRSDAYTAYKDYCNFYGLDNESDKAFVQRLKNTPKISPGTVPPKNLRAWKGLGLRKLNENGTINTLTDLTDSRGIIPLANFNNDSKKLWENKERVKSVKSVRDQGESETVGTDATTFSKSEKAVTPDREQRTCGDCELHTKPSCVFPGINFDKVPANSNFAIDCRSFTPKREGS